MNAKKGLCLLLCAALLGGLCACTAEQGGETEQALTLRAAVCGPIESLDPTRNTDAAAESVFSALFENLLRMEQDENGEPTLAPGLAKEYKVSDNLDGTLTYTFTLRASTRWSDGERVRANDFVYAWQRLIDPALDNPNHALLSMVVGYDEVRETGNTMLLSVRADSSSVFSVTVKADCPWFLTEVCTSTVTIPLRRKTVQANPDTWMQSDELVSCGAYCVESWDGGQTLVLVKNEGYYGARRIEAERIVFTLSDDTQALYERYRAGELDLLAFSGDLTPEEPSQRLRATETVCLLVNNLGEWTDDVQVRTALRSAVDPDAAAQALGAATHTAATALVPECCCDIQAEHSFREVGGVLLTQDAQQRERELAEALPSVSELQINGAKLTLLYTPQHETLAQLLLSRWRSALNIEVEAVALDGEAMEQRLSAGEYDLALCTLACSTCDAQAFLAPWQSKSAENVIGYADSSYDLLLGAAENSDSVAARMAFLHDAEALLLEDQAVLPLAFGARAWLLRDGLTGLAFSAPDVFRYDELTQISAG